MSQSLAALGRHCTFGSNSSHFPAVASNHESYNCKTAHCSTQASRVSNEWLPQHSAPPRGTSPRGGAECCCGHACSECSFVQL